VVLTLENMAIAVAAYALVAGAVMLMCKFLKC
jgi:hypothetical protein